MTSQQQNTYNLNMDWWNALDHSWQIIFCYDYLQKRCPDILNRVIWDNKEIVGLDDKMLECIVDTYSVINHLPCPLYFVILEALRSENLFDFSNDFFWTFKYNGSNYKIHWSFFPKSSNGLRGLKELKSICFYKQNYAASVQPKIEVMDFMNLHNLEELHLHISHCYQLEDILLLNLPKLRKIGFYAGVNEYTSWCVAKEESIINAIKSRTRVTLELNCYPDS